MSKTLNRRKRRLAEQREIIQRHRQTERERYSRDIPAPAAIVADDHPLAGLSCHRQFGLRATSADLQNRTVRALLTTETPVLEYSRKHDRYVKRVLLTSGATWPASNQIPLLDAHHRSSVAHILGSARSLAKESDGLAGTLHFSSTAQSAWELVRDGHTTDVSAGFQVDRETYIPAGETKIIGGRSFTGPINVATEWIIFEVSLVVIGADEAAKIRGGHAVVSRELAGGLDPLSKRVFGIMNSAVDAPPEVVAQIVQSMRSCANLMEAYHNERQQTESDEEQFSEEDRKQIAEIWDEWCRRQDAKELAAHQ